MTKNQLILPPDYGQWLKALIGREIAERQSKEGWGAQVIVHVSADQLPWFHIVTLITKISDPVLREWYAKETLAQSWSRDTLNIQIEAELSRELDSEGAEI